MPPTMEQSASRIDVRITVVGKGESKAEIFRHLAPITVNTIMTKMPILGRVNRLNDNTVCILAEIFVGTEKGRTKFAHGDIALLPLNGSICIFLKESISARPMNLIGKIGSNLEILERSRRGDTITIEKV
jgi:hypothetical protein|tara:strand:+ start:1046 stop:1435 length:390 start_codon:yes stop_codon:yes gene_type:complete